MERVQYSLEASLPELKDLQNNGIFSPVEIKEIIKRRANYELQLIRRQPRKKDFLDYIEYEMALERLRRKRVARLDTPIPHSLSSHSLVQKQFSIFERATRKFKEDVRLWVQYIDVAKREGAGNLVGRIAAKALKLHPSSIPLYILAAQHELDQSLPSAARNLLQRGIRINNESVDLWCEYVKMELGWCELLKRRWETLGIQSIEADPETDADSARKEVLNGAIVKEVLKNALQALPILKMFNELLHTLQTYPTPLSKSLIPFLFAILAEAESLRDANQAQIHALYATRHLSTLPKGKNLVEGLKLTNEELVTSCNSLYEEVNSSKTQPLPLEAETLKAYAEFVSSQWETITETNLRLYLSSSLYNVCNTVLQNGLAPGQVQTLGRDAVFSTHLRLLLDPTYPQPSPSARKVLKLARQYSVASSSASVWKLRLEAEKRAIPGTPSSATSPAETLEEVSRLARSRCTGDEIETVWTWGWDQLAMSQREALIKESFSLPLNSATIQLREILLLQILSSIYQKASIASTQSDNQEATAKWRQQIVMRLLQSYFSSPEVYRHVFDLEQALPTATDSKSPLNGQASPRILENIYLLWRDHSLSSKEDATFAYAAHMLNSGLVGKATRLVNNLVSTGSGDARDEMEKRWKRIIEGESTRDEEESKMDIDEPADEVHDSSEEDASDVEFVVVG